MGTHAVSAYGVNWAFVPLIIIAMVNAINVGPEAGGRDYITHALLFALLARVCR